jgi:LmbE family N-acetylglucosaminyl deacetylase
MRWIYLSPHFDDAVLSCGGLIFDQRRAGEEVEIWTIFAGDPPPGPLSEFASGNHQLWGVTTGEQVVAMRKAEDQAAAAIVGARPVHFGIPDCIYRRSPEGVYLYTESVFALPHPADKYLPRRIAAALKSELEPTDVLVCPLTLGSHVDHILARRAAEFLHRPLRYYADIPYLLNKPEVLEPAVRLLESQAFPVSPEGLEAWIHGVEAYKSQVDSLYYGDGTLFEAIRGYCERENGLKLWNLP